MEPKPQPQEIDTEGSLDTLDEEFLEEPDSWDVDDFNDILDVDTDWPY